MMISNNERRYNSQEPIRINNDPDLQRANRRFWGLPSSHG